MNIKRERLDTKPKGTGKLGLITVGVGILSLVNIAATGMFGVANLASGSSSNFVQLNSGETVEVKKVNSQHREPENIITFVDKIYTGFYTSSGYMPVVDARDINNPVKDPGVEINGAEGKRVATGTWEASLAFEPKLRQELLVEIAKVTPQSIFEQKKSIVFLPSYIGQPIPVADKPGHWTVNLVSTLIPLQNGKQLGKVIPNNKKIYVRAVRTPQYDEFTSSTAEIIAKARKAGLEIYHQHELNINELQKEITK